MRRGRSRQNPMQTSRRLARHMASGQTRKWTRFFQVILDTSAGFWARQTQQVGSLQFPELLDALCILTNAALSSATETRFEFLVADESGSHVVFPSEEVLLGTSSESTVENLRRNLVRVLRERGERADDATDGAPHVATALSRALCFVSKYGAPEIDARVLIVQGGEDFAPHYNAMMNAIFSAAKLSVNVDCLSIGASPPAMLQQACFLTKGCFYHLEASATDPLLLVLLTIFAPDVATRGVLRMPTLKDVDFRASCICHQRPVEIALVCPVCLSVFCEEVETKTCYVCGFDQPNGNE
eukprot:scaffold16_cov242-Pinguiococcus_pyrenoidosus.AAC.1